MKTYKWTFIILLIGGTITIGSIIYDVVSFKRDTHYIDFNDTETLSLEEGKYTILLDEYSAFNHRVRDTSHGVLIEINPDNETNLSKHLLEVEQNNAMLTLRRFSPNTSMELSFSRGTFYGIATLDVPKTGDVTFDMTQIEGSDYQGELMITNIDIFSLVFRIIKNVLLGLATIFGGIISFVIALTKKKQPQKLGA